MRKRRKTSATPTGDKDTKEFEYGNFFRQLNKWISQAETAKSKKMRNFARYIKSDRKAVEMACLTNYSNGMMEGTVNKIKEIKRTMFNRAGIELLRAKVIYANYGNVIT